MIRSNRITGRLFERKGQTFFMVLILVLYITNYRPANIQNWLLSNKSDSDLACPIPKLEPYSKVVKEYLKNNHKTFYSCEEKFPFLFNSTLDAKIVPLKTIDEYKKIGVTDCCYRLVTRTYLSYFKRFNDNSITLQNKCYALSLVNSTQIPSNHEVIAISCKVSNASKTEDKIMDVHAFIHIKPEVEKRQNEIEDLIKANRKEQKDKVNVVIFGMDALSRMNFLRSLPRSYEYLMKNLSAVDMAGYNKVEDNTFPNMVPFLTSLTGKKVSTTCGKNKTYDNCPFIWKHFAEQGYRTSYAEDESHISTFNFERKGFINPPTDYYFRPYSIAANLYIAHQWLLSAKLCYGPRLGFEVLLDNMRKFVYQMSKLNKPYFQYTWSTSLTHDHLKAPALGDRHLLNTVQWLKESGYMNNTIFILMSDHGMRVESFRNSLQGQLEDRLPFALFLLPDWMKSGKYSRAYQNLVSNQNRLITTFDLHQALVDFLDVESLENESIQRREELLSGNFPHQISPFLPIPKSRTCEMAGIGAVYCACNYLQPVDTQSSSVIDAAKIAVKEINEILKHFSNCSSLELNSVKLAEYAGQRYADWEGYQINFETKPGNALFEALVSKRRLGSWKVAGSISRTNLYRNQSHCVHDNVAKLYCFCKDIKIKE